MVENIPDGRPSTMLMVPVAKRYGAEKSMKFLGDHSSPYRPETSLENLKD